MTIISLLLAILVFGVLIALHEFGHFIAAKAFGVRVNEYSIGMGPAIFSFEKNETLYSLRAIPCGGYCALEGEEEDSDDPNSLNNKSIFAKLVIFSAGALMNLLTGIIIVLILYSNAKAFYQPVITDFAEGNVLEHVVFEKNDRLLKINGERVYIYSDVSLLFSLNKTDVFSFEIERNNKIIKLENIELQKREYLDQEGIPYLGYGLFFGAEEATFLDRISYSFNTVLDFARSVRLSLQMIFNGDAGVSDISGPVGIVSTMTEVSAESTNVLEVVDNTLYFGALIAVNLCIMNLLPIPALDGGKIFFLLVNAVSLLLFKKQVPAKFENYIHFGGLVLLLVFMLFITFQDVLRILS